MASLPATVDLTVYQGATFLQSFRWMVGTTGKDLTGWTGRMQIRPKPGDPVALVSLTTGAGISLDASGSIVVRKYAVDIGNGTATAITVTHNLGTLDVDYTLYEKSTGIVVDADVIIATTNTITITFATAPTASQYRCVVAG